MLENILLNDCFGTTVRTNVSTLVMENSENSWKVMAFLKSSEYEPCETETSV